MGYALRLGASGAIPGSWVQHCLPAPQQRQAYTGRLKLEIVSHCWKYAHFLAYQLSSLVLFPPRNLQVTLTVYFCREDRETCELLAWFENQAVDNVVWNWRALPRQQLFRRAIGRNHAAKNTQADWIWFTDCDLMFRLSCLDTLAQELQGRREALVYPKQERVTSLLPDHHSLLNREGLERLRDIPEQQFVVQQRNRAAGPLQITHGDVARACGYCDNLRLYQTPSEKWCKAYEDRAFRWLLGTRGTPLDIPGVYRIRHITKGRYTGSEFNTGLRSRLRRLTSFLGEKFR